MYDDLNILNLLYKQLKMSAGWERIRLRVETGESLDAEKPKETRTLSTHVLDTSLGKAAAEVPLTVYRLSENQQWQELKQLTTNKDGRASQMLEINDFKSGIYKLKFDVQNYYASLDTECFYPFIEIAVKCVDGQHYHIPLLLSPFGYTTYRGT